MITLPTGSPLLVIGMIGLSAFLLVPLLFALRSWKLGAAILGWVALVCLVAWAGGLAHFWPPRPILVVVPTFAMIGFLAQKQDKLIALPLWLLVGFQSFRILVELLIHMAVEQGISPPQLSWYPGLNYDIVTGVTALLLAPFASRVPRGLLRAWNLLGLMLLLWVVLVAILSLPTPIQQFTPDNTWVAHFPYVLLPIVLVGGALLGHITLFRKLREEAGAT